MATTTAADPTEQVTVKLLRDHAEQKKGDVITVTRYIAEKLSAPERGIADGKTIKPVPADSPAPAPAPAPAAG